MKRRFAKRALELIGAVAVVYIMLEIIESSSGVPESSVMVRVGEDENAVEVSLTEFKKMQDEIRKVQLDQARHEKSLAEANDRIKEHEVQSTLREKSVTALQKVPAPVSIVQHNKPAKVVTPKVTKAPVVITSPPAKPDEPEEPEDDGPIDLGVNTDFDSMGIPKPVLKSKGYILPMLYFDMGPNNLFRLFRQGIVTAYEMGRTIVSPVFHRHPRMGDDASNPFVLPIFDTNYTVDLVWPPSDTFDVLALKKVLPVASMREMKKNCKGKLDAIVKCGIIDEKRYDGIKHFQRAADMKVVKEIEIKTYEELVPNTLEAGIIGPDDAQCLGIVYGKKCLPDQDRWLATFSKIGDNFLRPMPTRRFANEFMKKRMGGRPFMAVHWRYESDWLDMCKPTRPKGARQRNKEICKTILGLTYDDDTRDSFVASIKRKLAQYDLKVIYLASPPNNIDLIRLLNASFPGNFFYSDDVTKYAEETEGPEFLSNNYKASFVEQEICFKSTVFLAAPLSSWTQTVLTDRLMRGNFNNDNVLRVIGEGKEGFPDLVFQFPEGNFNFGGMIKKNDPKKKTTVTPHHPE